MARFTPQEAARRMRFVLPKEIETEVKGELRKGLKESRKRVVQAYKRKGHDLWLKKGRSGRPKLIVKTIGVRWSRSARAFTGGLKLRGMAAIMEEGGRTKRHKIEPRGKFLVFDVAGKTVFARRVAHPGSQMPDLDIAEREIHGFIDRVAAPLKEACRRAGRRAF